MRDLNAIELTEVAHGEAILSPGHYGTDDPQPTPCTECGGSGRSKIPVRGNNADIDCSHCHGQGAIEP